MPTITTLAGTQITFDASSVYAMTEASSGTGIYGIGPTPVTIGETPQAFLATNGLQEKFSELTRPDGSKIFIRGQAVTSLRSPLDGEYPDTAKTVLTIGSAHQAVEESPDSATAAINRSRGPDTQL